MPASNLRAFVRLRPSLSSEQHWPLSQSISLSEKNGEVHLSNRNTSNPSSSFSFDGVIPPTSSQDAVWKRIEGDKLLDALLEGRNVSIFAYGQTGSGKTYTIEGRSSSLIDGKQATEEDEGLIPRLVRNLFRKIDIQVRKNRAVEKKISGEDDEAEEHVVNANAETDTPVRNAESHESESVIISPIIPIGRTAAGAAGGASENESITAISSSLITPEESITTITYEVRVSYFQVYNELIYDLLNKGGGDSNLRSNLRLRYDHKWDKFFVENLFIFECSTPEEAISLFEQGKKNRITSTHNLNAFSSRSHSCFRVDIQGTVKIRHPTSSKGDDEKEAHDKNRNGTILYDDGDVDLIDLNSSLLLVDLAGSEKSRLSGAEFGSLAFREATYINKSLFCLRKCILALAKRNATGGSLLGAGDTNFSLGLSRHSGFNTYYHASSSPPGGDNNNMKNNSLLDYLEFGTTIPFRESKLTCILKHALGGNSETVMIGCINPFERFHDDNLSTLNYASTARSISNDVTLNLDKKSLLIQQLRAEIRSLQQEIKHLKEERDTEFWREAAVRGASLVLHQTTLPISQPSLTLPSSTIPSSTPIANGTQIGSIDGSVVTAGSPTLPTIFFGASMEDSRNESLKQDHGLSSLASSPKRHRFTRGEVSDIGPLLLSPEKDVSPTKPDSSSSRSTRNQRNNPRQQITSLKSVTAPTNTPTATDIIYQIGTPGVVTGGMVTPVGNSISSSAQQKTFYPDQMSKTNSRSNVNQQSTGSEETQNQYLVDMNRSLVSENRELLGEIERLKQNHLTSNVKKTLNQNTSLMAENEKLKKRVQVLESVLMGENVMQEDWAQAGGIIDGGNGGSSITSSIPTNLSGGSSLSSGNNNLATNIDEILQYKSGLYHLINMGKTHRSIMYDLITMRG